MRDPAVPITSYREFADALMGLCEHLTRLVRGDQAFVPMAHYLIDRQPHSAPIAQEFFIDDEAKQLLVNEVLVPAVSDLGATAVGWTFCGITEQRMVEPAHEAAVVILIDRERVEIHEARLVRHDNVATLGAWRPWPVDRTVGLLVTPLQEALR